MKNRRLHTENPAFVRRRLSVCFRILPRCLLFCGILCFGSADVFAASVMCWGDTNSNKCTPPTALGGNIEMLAGGGSHSIALKSNGTVVTWGGGYGGDTNDIPTELTNVVAIAAGYDHNLALLADSTVAAWGLDNSLQCYIFDGMSNVTAIAAGYNNSVALQADGTVAGRGQYINYTQNVYTTNSTEVVALASGRWHDFGLRADGTLVDLRGGYVPAGVTGVVAIAAGSSHGVNAGRKVHRAAGRSKSVTL